MFGERVGFLKFKADIFYEETGYKVLKNFHALVVNPNSCRFILLKLKYETSKGTQRMCRINSF